jgi:endonuclease/exonuclease/phosphatase family metal-dependent hydrolase
MNSEASLAILQWNLGNFDVAPRLPGRGYRGMAYTHASASRDEDLDDFAAVIRAENPDLITLQEVDVRKEHHRRLASLAGYEVAAFGKADDRHTQALLIKTGAVATLRALEAPAGVNGVGARVRWNENGKELAVFSNHSSAGILTRERAAQHRTLADWSKRRRKDGPLLIGGDFNFDDAPGSLLRRVESLRVLPFFPRIASSDWAEDVAALREVKEALRDLGAEAGPTAGAPRHWPKILLPFGFPLIPLGWALGAGRRRSRLDYVFGSGVAAVESRVISLTGPSAAKHPDVSDGAFPWLDHDPVFVRIRLDDKA